MGKLNPTQVRNLAEPGRYIDGDGLMLEIKPSGSKTWLVRLQAHGRRRDYGLGSFKDVSLSEARDKAREFRRLLRRGTDPLEAKRKAALRVPTFREAAIEVHGEHKSGWKNAKHGAQWLSTLESYAFPLFGDVRVDMVDTGHVRDALAAIWLTTPETARRVRQRIATVLDYGHGKGWREQPFVMGPVNKALPRQPKKDGHFDAMPSASVPDFVARLRERTSIGRLALEALILTAVRSGEIRGACWREVDLDGATWTIPAERMKAGKQHIVPLSAHAVAAFRKAAEYRRATDDLVFHGLKRGKPLSDMTLLKVLRDMDEPYTVHGFRSAFRDWVAEETNVSGEIAEAALAHAIPNRVEAAYRRTNFLEKRRKLMEAWGKYCSGGTTKVVRLASAR
ncbi:phage integrase central domain-containing protein [Phenylobacterium sp.]|uniref:tyrosine-type recombinase/integrase n=1 Tax=Phenylobacterium sp. TaxID=1871053 RepID=UPI00286D96EA|nr:integrase arm-type DNA-binding domain-containing protein [Phenylobacterium sp.]